MLKRKSPKISGPHGMTYYHGTTDYLHSYLPANWRERRLQEASHKTVQKVSPQNLARIKPTGADLHHTFGKVVERGDGKHRLVQIPSLSDIPHASTVRMRGIFRLFQKTIDFRATSMTDFVKRHARKLKEKGINIFEPKLINPAAESSTVVVPMNGEVYGHGSNDVMYANYKKGNDGRHHLDGVNFGFTGSSITLKPVHVELLEHSKEKTIRHMRRAGR